MAAPTQSQCLASAAGLPWPWHQATPVAGLHGVSILVYVKVRIIANNTVPTGVLPVLCRPPHSARTVFTVHDGSEDIHLAC